MTLFAMFAAAAIAAAQPAAEQIPTIPPASIDESLEITGESLAAESLRSRMFVDVRVNDQGPFRFLVDSGADRSVIGAALATQLRLPDEDPVRLRSMAGSSQVRTVLIDTLTLGSSVIDTIVAPVLSERNMGARGIIGIDALADQRMMLDFENKRVTIQDSRQPEVREAGEIVVTARRRKGQLILTQVSVDGARNYAVIDTGAEVTIGNTPMRQRLLKNRRGGTPQTIEMISVTGETVIADLIIIPEIRIGGVIMRGVPVAFTDAPPFALFGLDKQPALLLGTDLLKNFRRVSLDFRNRKVRFTLPR